MNKQAEANGSRGIEWTDYTSNPVKGCQHGCRWNMPDGTTAICYAETVANKFQQHYPEGFEAHYWQPLEMEAWHKLKKPSRIFLDSMSDLMGHWVPDEQIAYVLENVAACPWHTFQLLTKNAPRLRKFDALMPPNLWVGASVPPSVFKGRPLSTQQQARMLAVTLASLKSITVPVKWMSIEPLSFDIAPAMVDCGLQWVVIGAASNGPKLYQPKPEWVSNLLATLDDQFIPVFFKGNLQWEPHREQFPGDVVKPAEVPLKFEQPSLFDLPFTAWT